MPIDKLSLQQFNLEQQKVYYHSSQYFYFLGHQNNPHHFQIEAMAMMSHDYIDVSFNISILKYYVIMWKIFFTYFGHFSGEITYFGFFAYLSHISPILI